MPVWFREVDAHVILVRRVRSAVRGPRWHQSLIEGFGLRKALKQQESSLDVDGTNLHAYKASNTDLV
jgi:hypothetical protein